MANRNIKKKPGVRDTSSSTQTERISYFTKMLEDQGSKKLVSSFKHFRNEHKENKNDKNDE